MKSAHVDDQHLQLWVAINTPEPIIRAPLTVESKGRPTASLRRYCMSASCAIDSIGGWMCTTMPFAAANSHSHSALGLSRKARSEPSPQLDATAIALLGNYS